MRRIFRGFIKFCDALRKPKKPALRPWILKALAEKKIPPPYAADYAEYIGRVLARAERTAWGTEPGIERRIREVFPGRSKQDRAQIDEIIEIVLRAEQLMLNDLRERNHLTKPTKI
jgi:hypothetical protein